MSEQALVGFCSDACKVEWDGLYGDTISSSMSAEDARAWLALQTRCLLCDGELPYRGAVAYVLAKRSMSPNYLGFGARVVDRIGTVQVIAVPVEHARWQWGRIASGMELAANAIAATLPEALEWAYNTNALWSGHAGGTGEGGGDCPACGQGKTMYTVFGTTGADQGNYCRACGWRA